MATKPKSSKAASGIEADAPDLKGRLRKLKVKNFRAIGSEGVEVELDKIVVLVGPNNAGKSSILRAYEVIMSEGSNEGKLKTEDFPNSQTDPAALPEIELETEVVEGEPGEQWIINIDGKKIVRERWVWAGVGAGKRSGWNAQTGNWDEKVPWGAPNVANSRRPQPHPVRAFDPPEDQAKQINDLLKTAVIDHAKKITDEDGASVYDKLLSDLQDFQRRAVEGASSKIEDIESRLNDVIASIFSDHQVEYDQPFEAHEKSITLFPVGGKLLLGPTDGHKSGLEYQGSGTRRTLLWAALRIISEEKGSSSRPHVLLIDEPELCLHPNAIREACKVLYDLANRPGWQVMVTTHSPVFIDLARDNTSIVRVERKVGGTVSGTTLFRPERAALSNDDKDNLKLLNLYDPYVAEFFFGGRVVVVEGDTEYSAFKYVMALAPEGFENVHIIRARGKATIASLAKILNHFGTSYAILHNADIQVLTVKEKKTGEMKTMVNPAWSNNGKILEAVAAAPASAKVRLVASLHNFEAAYFGTSLSKEKPYTAIQELKDDAEHFKTVHALLTALVDHAKPLPPGATEWSDIDELAKKVVLATSGT